MMTLSGILFLGIFTPSLYAQGATKITIPLVYNEEGLDSPTAACLTTSSNPAGPEQVLFNNWQRSSWNQQYCDGALANFTHKVAWGGGELLLTGHDLLNESYDNADVAAVHGAFLQMQRAAHAGNMDEYFDGFTAAGGKKQRNWYKFETAPNLKQAFLDNITTQRAVFIFDAEPVFVLYTSGGLHPVIALSGSQGPSDVQVIYFVREGDGFKRTGGSMGSAFDNVFQGQRFVDAASQDHPFASWRIDQRQ